MNRIIDVVMLEMQNELSKNQKEHLERVLLRVMSQYEIVPTKCELQTIDAFYEVYIKEFIIYLKSNGRADGTIEQYVETAKKMFDYIKKDVTEVTDTDIRLFLAVYEQCRKVSKRRIDNMRRNLSAFFKFCLDLHYIDRNPCDTIRPIKIPKEVKKPYTIQEMSKLEKSANGIRNKAIIALLRSSGIRVSELVSLNRIDLNFGANTFFVWGKGGKEREVCFDEETAKLLKEYLATRIDSNEALFVHKTRNERLRKPGVESMVKKLGIQNNIKAYPHKFRRTLVTRALDQHMQPHLVAHLAGHSSIRTTMIYCTADTKKMKKEYKKLKL